MSSLSHLTVDQLADGICLRAGRIAAAEAELLAWIGEFDARGGWSGVGMLTGDGYAAVGSVVAKVLS